MKKQNDDTGFSVIPEGEKTCIWMDAGLVNFKLCDRDFQCETCPFNKAMESCYQNHTELKWVPELLHENFDSSLPVGLWKFRLDTSLYLSSCHTWMRPMGVKKLRMGLDDFIVSLLDGVDRIVMPKEGSKIKAGEPIAEIFQGKRIFTVISPLKGTVSHINKKLESFPGLLSQEPTAGGYLCDIDAKENKKTLRLCKTGKELLRWYYHEIEWVELRIAEVLDTNRALYGELAYDGGTIAPLSEILPDSVYRNVISGLLAPCVS